MCRSDTSGVWLAVSIAHAGTGRWARRDRDGEWASPIERGRIASCRLWRAEWSYSLLPDDASAIEARNEETLNPTLHDIYDGGEAQEIN